MNNKIYYKLVCIDQQHAIIACQQLNFQNSIKAICLGRAIIVSINTKNIEQLELSNGALAPTAGAVGLAETNSFLARVQVEAMAFSDELSKYDLEAIEAT